MTECVTQFNVLVTRASHQANKLCCLIEQQGWQATRFPVLYIVNVDSNKVKQQLATLKQWDWLIFISSNAVNFAKLANKGNIDCFKPNAIAAVGKATAQALLSVGLSVDLLPETTFNTEGVLATTEMQQVKGKKCLIVRGTGGREKLANQLRARGAIVDYLEVYRREIPKVDNIQLDKIFKQQTLHAITITSGNALDNLMVMVGTPLASKLKQTPLVVISHRIKELAEKIGFVTIFVTENASDEAMVNTLLEIKNKC